MDEQVYDLMDDSALDAGKGQDTRKRYAYGLLLPLGVEYRKWGEGGGVINASEFVKLKPNEAGQFVIMSVSSAAIGSNAEHPIRRKEGRGFSMWRDTVFPSIMEVTGKPAEDALKEFRDRAKSGAWYVEAELVPTGRTYEVDDPTSGQKITKMRDTFKFLRMTQDKETVIGWFYNRYGHKPGDNKNDDMFEEVVPQSAVESAKGVWAFVKGDMQKFESFIGTSDETKQYSETLVTMAKQNLLN